MKKLIFVMVITCLMPVFSHADEVDDALPSDTPAAVKESARQTIEMGVESRGVIQMTRTMLQNQYKEKQMVQAHEVLMKAQQDGLPQEPVMNKFNESVANNEKAKNTIKAMETVRTQYKTASDMAGEMTRDREQARVMTEEMAQCMASGMKNGDMEQITTALQNKTREMTRAEAYDLSRSTFAAVKRMAQSGASSGSAENVAKAALKKQYSPQDMEKVATAFMAEVKNAGSATALANSFANAIKNGASADNVGNYASHETGQGFGQGSMNSDSGGWGSSSGSGGFGNSRGGGSGGGRRGR